MFDLRGKMTLLVERLVKMRRFSGWRRMARLLMTCVTYMPFTYFEPKHNHVRSYFVDLITMNTNMQLYHKINKGKTIWMFPKRKK